MWALLLTNQGSEASSDLPALMVSNEPLSTSTSWKPQGGSPLPTGFGFTWHVPANTSKCFNQGFKSCLHTSYFKIYPCFLFIIWIFINFLKISQCMNFRYFCTQTNAFLVLLSMNVMSYPHIVKGQPFFNNSDNKIKLSVLLLTSPVM